MKNTRLMKNTILYSLFLTISIIFVALPYANAKPDSKADLRAHFKKAPRSVADAIKRGIKDKKIVILIVWNDDVEVRNGIDWWLNAMLKLHKTEKLLNPDTIITALPIKKLKKHPKLLDGKEEWSQPYLLFVDAETQTVVHKIKAYANPETTFGYLTDGIKKWSEFKTLKK